MLTPDPLRRGFGAAEALHPGAVIAGKYRVKRVLGHGGMGIVYKAENLAIGRTVAVKVLHPHLADDGLSLRRFQREARASASVGHRHVVEVLDMGIEPSGAPFIVMEYMRGKSVAQILRAEGSMDPARACRVAGQVLEALASVHRQGVLHRDLKPENVLVSSTEGQPDFVKIFDFGIATFSAAARDRTVRDDLTPAGRTMGTPYYASPEQLEGAAGRDGRVDLYAVGVMLFEMVTGSRPFEGGTFAELCRRVTTEPPPPFRVFKKGLSPELEGVVMKALAKKPADRYEDASAMLNALVPFGAIPASEPDPEPTDTFTTDMRELIARADAVAALADETAASQKDVKGEVVASISAFLRERLGVSAYGALLGSLEPALYAQIVAPIDAGAWYPSSILSILARADVVHGTGDFTVVADAGRFLGKGGHEARVLGELESIELLFARLPDLWRRYFATGRPTVTNVGRGYGQLEIVGADGALVRGGLFVACVDELLERSGARQLETRLAKARALGDETDVIEASWSI